MIYTFPKSRIAMLQERTRTHHMKQYQFIQLQNRINELSEERQAIFRTPEYSNGYGMNEETVGWVELINQRLAELHAEKRRLLRFTNATFVGLDR